MHTLAIRVITRSRGEALSSIVKQKIGSYSADIRFSMACTIKAASALHTAPSTGGGKPMQDALNTPYAGVALCKGR